MHPIGSATNKKQYPLKNDTERAFSTLACRMVRFAKSRRAMAISRACDWHRSRLGCSSYLARHADCTRGAIVCGAYRAKFCACVAAAVFIGIDRHCETAVCAMAARESIACGDTAAGIARVDQTGVL